MNQKALFAIDKNDKKRIGKTHEIQHKISLCWVKKLDTEGQAKLSKELNVILPVGKKPSIRMKEKFQNAVAALDKNEKRMLKQKYQSHNIARQQAMLMNYELGIDWIQKLDNEGQIMLAQELIEPQPAQKTIKWNHEVVRKVRQVLAAMDKNAREQIKEKYRTHILA